MRVYFLALFSIPQIFFDPYASNTGLDDYSFIVILEVM